MINLTIPTVPTSPTPPAFTPPCDLRSVYCHRPCPEKCARCGHNPLEALRRKLLIRDKGLSEDSYCRLRLLITHE